MRKFHFVALLTGLISAVSPAFAELDGNIRVIAFSTENYPIQRSELADEHYYLDAVEILEDKFSQSLNLNDNPDVAERQIKAMMNSPQWQQFEQQLIEQYQGVQLGWSLGVMKVPAVVFVTSQNETAAVYGETNIAKAIQRYLAYQESVQ